MSENKVKWHPYPQERPIEDDDYLITVKYRRTRKVMKWDSVNGYFYIEGNVTAWADLPEPYKEEEMTEYTWDDIVFNPNLYRAKDIINKKVYFADSPAEVLFNANKNIEIGILGSINVKDNHPFGIICNNCTFGYGCIIFEKEDTYEEREKKWVKENDLKVGDYVKVQKEAESHENGWNAEWVSAMYNCVGKTLKVMSISPIDSSIILECNDAAYSFPYFVLEKVEPPKPKYVPFESAEEFIKAFDCYTHPDKDSEIKSILYMFGMWLKWKGEYVAVTHISDNGINDNTIEADWQDLCDNYTFLNGTPCGEEVKE